MTEMGPLTDRARPETLSQWLVRGVGLLGFFGILGAVPITQLVVGKARSQPLVAPLNPTGRLSFWNGDWSAVMERYAQESSPVTFTVRGHYTETLYRLGLLDPYQVFLGEDGWMFMASTLHANPAQLDALAPKRRLTLESIRRRCEELGVKLLAVPVPDKVRIYPEKAFADGKLPSDREGLYARILSEFEAAGIPTLDVEKVLRRAKQTQSEQLYYERDTHWTGRASLLVAEAVMRRLTELGWDGQLGEPVSIVPSGSIVEIVPDLVGALGFRAVSGPFKGSKGLEDADHHYQQVSSLARSLSVEKQFFHLKLAEDGDGSPRSYQERRHLGKVALAGTSFSQELFGGALAYVLGRLVDTRGVVSAGGPFKGLQEQLALIERGESSAVVVIWETIERFYLEPDWQAPPVF